MERIKLLSKKKTVIYVSVIVLSTVMILSSSVMGMGNTNAYNNGHSVYRTDIGNDGNYQTSFQGYYGHFKISPNVMVNAPQQSFPNGLLGRSETSIASTTDGRHLVAGWNDAQGLCGSPFGNPCPPAGGFSGYAYSTNGGLNWTDGGAPSIINNVYTRGDPWLDSNGRTIFYANLAVNNNTGASLGVSVHRGHFTNSGNFVWTDVHTMDSPKNILNPGSDLYDKESITVAKDGSGAAYVSLTNFQEICNIPQFGYGTIELWRTHDGGNTWQGPTVVSPDQSFIHDSSNPTCGYYGSLQLGSVVGIGPHGEVYVTWIIGPTFSETGISPKSKVMVATSLDGGVTFGQPVEVGQINDTFYDTPVAFNRPYILETPTISVARSGPDKGRVFISYISAASPILYPNPIAQNFISTQVLLAYSDNNGQTWKNVQVVAPPPSTTVKRFYPALVTGPNGNVNLIYYQSTEDPSASTSACSMYIFQGGYYRTGPAHSLVDVYLAQSTNGGLTFNQPQKLTSVTTDWCSVSSDMYPNMGDYIGATSTGNHLYAVWADGRNGIPDVYATTVHET